MSRLLILAFIAFFSTALPASAQLVRGVTAEGACAIVGMSAEQSQLTALQRARAAAIEQAAGVEVSASTLVTNMALTADFIKSYARGFVVSERAQWLPLGQYQKDPSTPPIPEYRVRITADIMAPEKKTPPLGLRVKTNGVVYRNGEKATLEMQVERRARIAVFNITADDKVVMLFPNEHEGDNALAAGKMLSFPASGSPVELGMQTLPDHKRDAEAFFVVAMDGGDARSFSALFRPGEPLSFSRFFARYAELAEYCEDSIITYEVVACE